MEREEAKGQIGKLQEELEGTEDRWKEWAVKAVQTRAGKVMALERKKWQAKGKATLVETVNTASQTDHEPAV